MEEQIKRIQANKTPCFFISPHLDDAALSCGGLIEALAKSTEVTVITVFTKTGQIGETLSAKQALRAAKFPDASSYYAARIAEDHAAFAGKRINLMHLGEIEALWRAKKYPSRLANLLGRILPEFTALYPTYRLHITSGKLANEDTELISKISKRLRTIIPVGAAVFAPLAVGNHVDHVVTRKAVEVVATPYFWIDQPYISRKTIAEQKKITGKRITEFTFDKTKKLAMMQAYVSQLPLLYPETDRPMIREFYLLPGD